MTPKEARMTIAEIECLHAAIEEAKQQLSDTNRRIEYLELCNSEASQQLAVKDALLKQIKQTCVSYIINYGNSNIIRSIVTSIDEELR